MAHIPSPERVAEIQAITKQAIETKIKEQQEEGKDFVSGGAGVIPEATWQAMKEPKL